MSAQQLCTIARYSFPHEAHIARASLEAAGIAAYVQDEHTVNMNWLYSNALGGVRLQVAATDVAQALALLGEDFSTTLAPSDEAEPHTPPACPRCAGQQWQPYTQGKRPAFVVFLLLGFPLFFYRHGQRCQGCGYFRRG
ncbi:Putative signal transducing protein [Atopomonas hussainii]|uniref:Putative signal transducing protein n=1 Tax=Atopomonas hussainii TaxID=1429083 RepID=A0A1H7LSR9_9GAMM|nr:DUF2007 domain-containing protein [Atopomonas hussainii]SEL02024.1 Putative signal transducing protein [Atopomonas hussainii]